MKILLNGESKQIPPQTNAQQLIDMMALSETKLAMEINRQILPRSKFTEYCFSDGDCVEIVQAIGGG